jgi:hypothetical protein
LWGRGWLHCNKGGMTKLLDSYTAPDKKVDAISDAILVSIDDAGNLCLANELGAFKAR